MRCSFERKLLIVGRIRNGEPIYRLSREYNVHEDKIRTWVRMMARYGSDGLRRQPRTKATPDFKEGMVRKILDEGIPLSRVMIDYRVSRTALERWVSIVRKGGYEALRVIRQ
ncbi:hypothetical protein [Xylanibacter muris]|uniref:Transposase n=2 Tax=Xylanibacter muris TaxID=2736290 RepID=A0ABX2AQJ5_9BACT|nr:hypothetical protein [Xylanibacter muris]NPD92500.1 hypothetical protein [Xylanibacter muris]